MSSAPTAEETWRDATWLAQAVDPRAGLVRFVQLSPEDYRRESFLDDRILGQGRDAHLIQWANVSSPTDARSDARWIFHIGHVGSTLISRLLGELADVLAVREPRALRDLTFFPPEARAQFIPGIRALMSRTFGEGEVAIVKATSMVSQIAAELAGSAGRALFLFASPRVYIETILSGDQSPSEFQTLATYYAERARAQNIELGSNSPAEVAALVWACEMTALEDAAGELGDGALWQDFDAFLAAPAAALSDIAAFFALTAHESQIHDVAAGPLMTRYSKAPEYEFGPDARSQRLGEAARRYSEAIDAALAMLRRAAEKAPLLQRALDRSNPDC
nr:hypothetical protein [Sphingomonas sp.]